MLHFETDIFIKEFSAKFIEKSSVCENNVFSCSSLSVAEASKEILYLLSYVLQKDTVYFKTHKQFTMNNDEHELFVQSFERRINGEPLAYIKGVKEFFGLDFYVNKSTLIPRADTEILVEKAIAFLQKTTNKNLIDLGTGTGCIPISILHAVPTAKALAFELDQEAVALAKSNAIKNSVEDRIHILKADFMEQDFTTTILQEIYEKFAISKVNLLVSNPPYIPELEYEQLDKSVKAFEPKNALLSDNIDNNLLGAVHIKRVIEIAENVLESGGLLLIEHGYNQGEIVRKICESYAFMDIETLQDYGGNDRLLYAIRK